MKNLSNKQAEELLNNSLINKNIASFEVQNGCTVVHLKDGRKIEIQSGDGGEQFIDLGGNIDKYHVLIRLKEDNQIAWRFTNKSVELCEAEKIKEKEKEGLNDSICYISIEKE